jgi:hypothetical protein
VIWPVPRAPAQPVAGKAQPDRLSLGEVRVGATVEASLRVFADGQDTTGLAVKVEPPPFVRVKNVTLGTQSFGQFGIKVFCDVSLAIDTRRAGEHSGAVDVEVAGLKVKAPVSVTVLVREAGRTRVLVVETPFDKFSTSDGTHFATWLGIVKAARLDVDYWDVTPGQAVLRDKDLTEFDVILLAETGLIYLQEPDVERLKKFVDQGGRVVVAANAFYVGTVAKANEILIPYGLRMNATEPLLGEKFVLKGADIVADALTDGVKQVNLFRTSPTAVTDPDKGKVLVVDPVVGEAGFLAVGRSRKGEVVALGVSLWWSWIGDERAGGSDNARLLQNLVTKPGKKE